MPKLSPSLKSLLSLPASSPFPYPSPAVPKLHSALNTIRSRAESGGAGAEAWITLIAAAGVTVNSPESFVNAWEWARPYLRGDQGEGVKLASGRIVRGLEGERWGAGMIREVGLKCISFNGIPRTINALNAFRDHLPEEITGGLCNEQTRQPNPQNIDSITSRSQSLWDAIYAPQHTKLIAKLSSAHPDLPVHILNSHYGALLSDPEPSSSSGFTSEIPRAGRILTSMIAMTCLRAQTGVSPQVLSHVYGLMKAADQPGEEGLQGRGWLVGEEGVRWVLEGTDMFCEVVRGSGEVKAKL